MAYFDGKPKTSASDVKEEHKTVLEGELSTLKSGYVTKLDTKKFKHTQNSEQEFSGKFVKQANTSITDWVEKLETNRGNNRDTVKQACKDIFK